VVSTRRALDSYYNADATFDSTREAKFLSSIVDAFDSGDSEAFVGAVQEFDRLTKLVRALVINSKSLVDVISTARPGTDQHVLHESRTIGKLPFSSKSNKELQRSLGSRRCAIMSTLLPVLACAAVIHCHCTSLSWTRSLFVSAFVIL
jgi:hypothetical protein